MKATLSTVMSIATNKELSKQVKSSSFNIVGNILGPKPAIQTKPFKLGRDNDD
jgi:hypothetical protein